MARPRKPLDSDRRSRLLRHAREVFSHHGYAGSSLSDILAAAEFPRSSFYYFFNDKETLFEAAFSDGLALLADRLSPPDPQSLTAETFWPALLGFVDELETVSQDRAVATVAPLFHMPDAPASPARDAFERSARGWCAAVVHTGRELEVLDQRIPADLHVELVWSVAVVVDRWVVSRALNGETDADVTHFLLKRLLGADEG